MLASPFGKEAGGGSKQSQLKKFAEDTLGSDNLKLAVLLPDGEDVNEWVAMNIVDFYNQITLLYGTISEYCTSEECPTMSAGSRYEYHWCDGRQYKKPTSVSAPMYVDLLTSWVQAQLEDESIFPSKIGNPFPKNFLMLAKQILRRLFRVYGHMYHSHFKQITLNSEERHLNTSFKHFVYFIQEFDLVDKKELVPLADLIQQLCNDE